MSPPPPPPAPDSSDTPFTSVASTPVTPRHQRFTAYTAAACGVAAIGGTLFGYDIGVTGGVTADRYFLQKVRRVTRVGEMG